jgi:hypothetical protein
MKRVRVAVPNPDDCMHCERTLDDAAIPFDLIPHPESAAVLIYIEDESLPGAVDLLQRAGFTVDIPPESFP